MFPYPTTADTVRPAIAMVIYRSIISKPARIGALQTRAVLQEPGFRETASKSPIGGIREKISFTNSASCLLRRIPLLHTGCCTQRRPQYPMSIHTTGQRTASRFWPSFKMPIRRTRSQRFLPADGSMRVIKSLDWRSPWEPLFSPDTRFIAYNLPQGARFHTARHLSARNRWQPGGSNRAAFRRRFLAGLGSRRQIDFLRLRPDCNHWKIWLPDLAKRSNHAVQLASSDLQLRSGERIFCCYAVHLAVTRCLSRSQQRQKIAKYPDKLPPLYRTEYSRSQK